MSQARPARAEAAREQRGEGRGPERRRSRPRRAATASPACAGPPRHATGRSPVRSSDELAGQRAVGGEQALRQDEHADAGGHADARPTRARPRARGRAPPGTRRSTSSQRRSSSGHRRARCRAARRRAGRRRWCGSGRGRAPARRCGSRAGPLRRERASSVATAVPQLPAPTTTAWRIGCRPPSHSHCSEMHDQTRLEISCASRLARLAVERTREASARGRSGRSRGAGGCASRGGCPRCRGSRPGRSGAPVSSARRPTPRLGSPSGPGRTRVPSGKMPTAPPRSRITRAVSIASSSDSPRRIGNAPSASRIQAFQRLSNSSIFATKRSGRPRQQPDHERVGEAAVVRGQQHRARPRGCARARCGAAGSRAWKKGCRIARTTQ